MNWQTMESNGSLIISTLDNCSCRSAPNDASMFNLVVIIGFLPILSTFGLAANIINMYIYSSTNTSAERYLMALSISDFGICTSGILVIAADSLRPHCYIVDQAFVILLPKLIPFGLFFQTTSIYITVFAAIDCYVNICRCLPSKSQRNYCTVENANRILVGVFLVSALYNVVQFGELQAVRCYAPDLGIELYELCPTAMRLNAWYVTIYKGILYVCVMAFLPFVLLCFLTGLIVWELQRGKARKVSGQLSAEAYGDYTTINGQSDTKETDEDTSSPIVLVLVVVLFLFCNLISLLVNVCEMLEQSLDNAVQSILIDVGNMLVVVNATANIAIYAFGSKYYRLQAYQLLSFRRESEKIPQSL
ncbi:G-PROTEIN-RECEP-F1-2 domain-containing protein [Aphelenchoides besseyi]|nr:G-PROTEIN-RECEP-F1-2 domain-containing protein [Aphelenchoides besseyi]KAI6212043.1 G-PROTEIN-RECEP-F1-2 domain-containing protein [Aphelenchoides besseyi]